MQFGDMLIGRFNHRNKNKNTLQYRCERFDIRHFDGFIITNTSFQILYILIDTL